MEQLRPYANDEPIRFEDLILNGLTDSEQEVLYFVESGASSVQQLTELMDRSPYTIEKILMDLKAMGIGVKFYK